MVKVNTDVLTDLGQRFGIRSIPTLAVFADGREVTRTTGARPRKTSKRSWHSVGSARSAN